MSFAPPSLSRGELRQIVAAGAALATLYVCTALISGAGMVDDSYIFLRYTRNIWAGVGPVFNAGDPVEGYTSPLWLALLTAGWPVPVDPARLTMALSALCGLAIIFLLTVRESADRPGPAMLGAFFLATSPSFVFWAWSGMDTALFALLFAAAVLTFEADSRAAAGVYWRTGGVLTVAAFARLEALWLVPLFGLFAVTRSGSAAAGIRALVSLCLPAAVAHGAHLLWRHAYYGAWLPNTFTAKVGVPRAELLEHGIQYVARAMQRLVPLVVVLALVARHADAAARRHMMLPAVVALWWTVYVAGVGGDHFPLWRFLIPVHLMLALLVSRAAAHVPGSAGRYGIPALVAAAALGVNLWIAGGREAEEGRREVQRARGWVKAGRWCAAHLPRGTIATTIVGAIPFYCDYETVDLLGLVDRHVATQGRMHSKAAPGHQRFATEYVLSREPDYIMLSFSGQFDRPLLNGPEGWRLLPERTNYAMIDLLRHPTVVERYRYRAEPLPDGTWMEFLEKRLDP